MTRHAVEIPLRWGDMDAQAHVNNVAWVDYLQEARVDFLLRGPIAELLESGVLVVSNDIEFLAPMVADDTPLLVELWVDRVGGARFSLAYELSHHDQLVGRARTVATPYDLAKGRLRRLTDDERQALSAAIIPTEPLRELPTGEPQRVYEVGLQVRWSDLDAYGHVNNVEFHNYAQEARVSLFSSKLATEDGMWVVVRQQIRHHLPMAFRLAPYVTRLGVIAHGRTSITLRTQFADPDSGEVYATAGTVLVRTDAQGRPLALPADFTG
ncbi:acyl-CoA thioesterase [Propionibacteriaceae bacterium Y2011]